MKTRVKIQVGRVEIREASTRIYLEKEREQKKRKEDDQDKKEI